MFPNKNVDKYEKEDEKGSNIVWFLEKYSEPSL